MWTYQGSEIPHNARKVNRPSVAAVQAVDNLLAHRPDMQERENKVILPWMRLAQQGRLDEAGNRQGEAHPLGLVNVLEF